MAVETKPLTPLPQLTLLEGTVREQVDPVKLIESWLSAFEASLKTKDAAAFPKLFLEDSWWRDLVALSFDISTREGQVSIGQYLQSCTSEPHDFKAVKDGALAPRLSDMGGLIWVESGFSFETNYGTCRGIVRLANVGPESWKAWTVSTMLDSLKGQEDVKPSEYAGDEDLQVLVIGAGQCGLALGAQLKHYGLKALIVEKAAQVGGGWRDRYESVKLHTPTYSDHYPFLNYPDDWPKWLPREKLLDWMQHYAKTLKLNIRVNTTVKSVEYDHSARHYRVDVGGGKVLTPRHVVLATGMMSLRTNRVEFPKKNEFQGQVYYAQDHKSATQIADLANKKVAIVGAGTTALDIAEDLYHHGVKEVTILQRGPIFFWSRDSVEQLFLAPYSMMSLKDADLMVNSFPAPISRTLALGMDQMNAQNNKEMIEGLAKAGMGIRTGEDGVPFTDYALGKFGSVYVDQGAGQLIVDGKIKIQRCEEGIKEFSTDGVVLANEKKVEADVVILATGLPLGATSSIPEVMGKDFSEKLGEVGTVDENHERVGWWRPTKSPGFWHMFGSFSWSRQMSKLLALQIDAVEKEINPRYYEAYETQK